MKLIVKDLEQAIGTILSQDDGDNYLGLYFSSSGGPVTLVPILVDLIKKRSYKIYVSEAVSAALTVLMQLDKNKIKAYKNAYFMAHQIQWIKDKKSMNSWDATVNHLSDLQNKIWERYLPKNIIDFINQNPNNSYYFTAQEALDYGIIGGIIGEFPPLDK